MDAMNEAERLAMEAEIAELEQERDMHRQKCVELADGISEIESVVAESARGSMCSLHHGSTARGSMCSLYLGSAQTGVQSAQASAIGSMASLPQNCPPNADHQDIA